jgi:hypothetical protein
MCIDRAIQFIYQEPAEDFFLFTRKEGKEEDGRIIQREKLVKDLTN